MESFFHCGKEVEFWGVTGEVLSTDKFSETHVRSTGGGGSVSGHVHPQHGGQVSGYVAPPVIKSTVVTNHEIWIRTADGKEKNYDLSGKDIPLRAGQKVTVIYAGLKEATNGWTVLFVNHNAGKYWILTSPEYLVKRLKLDHYHGWGPPVLAIGGAVAFIKFGSSLRYQWGGPEWVVSAALVIAAVFATARFIKRFNRVSGLFAALPKHYEKVGQAALKNA